jgi:hypothetical protein
MGGGVCSHVLSDYAMGFGERGIFAKGPSREVGFGRLATMLLVSAVAKAAMFS